MIENTLPSEYSLIKFLGKGGFAETYLCQKKNGQKCVVKYLTLPEEDKKYIELARLEAKVLQSISHKNIPNFLDFLTVKNDKNIEMFLVQEYVEARTLKEIVESGKHFNEDQVKDIAVQMAKVLEYLHGFLPQIIHRDIKPANILLTEDNKIYLIDFGAVKERLTYYKISESGVSTIIGTQGYMPLEQFEGKSIPASDIYSLGLTLVYLLSHLEPLQLPKDGLNFRFRDKVNISDGFYNIIEKMINPDWKERYRSIHQVKSDILNLNKKGNKSLKKKKNQKNEIRELIKSKLYENETMVWYHKPDFYSLIKDNLKFIFAPLLFFPSITFLLIIITILCFKFITLFGAIEILAATLFISSLLFSSTFYTAIDLYKKGADNFKTVFYLTNNRIISTQLPDNKGFRYLNQHEIKDLLIEKKEYKDGSGNLIFYSLIEDEGKKPYNATVKDIKLEINGIKDVGKVEKLIMNNFYNE
jgi:serine/threonine protein kinase